MFIFHKKNLLCTQRTDNPFFQMKIIQIYILGGPMTFVQSMLVSMEHFKKMRLKMFLAFLFAHLNLFPLSQLNHSKASTSTVASRRAIWIVKNNKNNKKSNNLTKMTTITTITKNSTATPQLQIMGMWPHCNKPTLTNIINAHTQ